MNVKAKKNNHFLNLLEDRKLAEQYFSGKNMTEFNSLQLIKLQKNCKMIKTKYSQKLWLLSIYSFLGLENYDLALKTEHEHKKMMSSIRDLDVFESNLSYLLISGIISYEQCKQLGFDSDYIENLLEKYKKISMICYLIMGWAIIGAIKQIYNNLDFNGVLLLVLGGIIYTIGAVLYGVGKKVRYMHSVWHLFVLAGTILQFFSIYLYVL